MSKQEDHSPGNDAEENVDYVLRLFVTGASPNSVRAVVNIRTICEKHLAGRYRLEIIDVYQQRELAQKEQLVALPLLIKTRPLPEKRLIGDFSDAGKVMQGLGLI